MATARCRSGGIMPGDLPKGLIKMAPTSPPSHCSTFSCYLAMARKSFSQSRWPLRRFPPVFATNNHILWWSFSWYCSHFIFPFLFLPTPPLLWVLLLRFHCSLLRGFCLSLRYCCSSWISLCSCFQGDLIHFLGSYYLHAG